MFRTSGGRGQSGWFSTAARGGSMPRARERTRDRPIVVKPRGRTLYLHETYRITVSCTFWEKEPGPPYTKEWGKGGTCTTSTRVATTKTPPKHPNPQNTPPNTPQNTPRVSNVEPAHSCCSDVLAAARPDVRMVPQRRLLKPRGRDQPSNPAPADSILTRNIRFLRLLGAAEPRPPYTKE